jgi:hypothetical protein
MTLPPPVNAGPTLTELAQRIAAEMSIPADVPMTDEQAAEFRCAFNEAVGADYRLQWVPPAPVLTPENLETLVRECVTVVKPGETLVIRVPETWSPTNAQMYQERADEATGDGTIPFRVVVVIGAELGIAEAPEGGE